MKLSNDRILTTHVGSLPRPHGVVELMIKKANQEPYDRAAFDVAARQAVAEVVARQTAVGIDVVSDGEMSKLSYSTYVQERLTGWGEDEQPYRAARDMVEHPELVKRMTVLRGQRLGKRMKCVGPVAVKDREPLKKDLANFKAALANADVTEAFMNSISPGTASSFQRNDYYPTHEKYLAALIDVMKEEYRAIVDAGFLLQIDCPDLTGGSAFQDLSDAEFLKKDEQHIEAVNAALDGIPPEKVRIHVCWGNYEGPHDYDRPIALMAPALLKAKAQGLSIEAANPRHEHEWKVWRDQVKFPDDKVIIPGVIDVRTNYVEHPELVAQRIGRFTRGVDRERIIAGADCGFATFAGAGKIDPGVAYKKLRSLVEGAEIASRKMWKKK